MKNIYKIFVLPAMLIVLSPVRFAYTQSIPEVSLTSCEVPQPITQYIGEGIRYALTNQAAFVDRKSVV